MHGPIDAANPSHDISNNRPNTSNDDQTGIEAQPIGESNSIVLSHSIEKSTLNRNHPPPLPPELRSPMVGKQPRFLSEAVPICSSGLDSFLFEKDDEANSNLPQKSFDNEKIPLETGVKLTLYDSMKCNGIQVLLSVLNDYSYICVSPIPSEPNAEKFLRVRDVICLLVGKKESEVFSNPLLSNLNPLKCFSVVSTSGIYFDFEAKSVLEREVVVSSLLLILDEVHNDDSFTEGDAVYKDDQFDELNNTTYDEVVDTSVTSPLLEISSFVSSSRKSFMESTAYIPPQGAVKLLQQPTLEDGQGSEIIERGVLCHGCCFYRFQDVMEVCYNIIKNADDIYPDDFFCNGFNCIGCIDSAEMQYRKEMIQSYFISLLGSSSQLTAALGEGHVWALDEKKIQSPRRIIRNRATRVNAQARRLRRLRNEMTFMHAVKTVSQKMRWTQTTRSFDDEIDSVDDGGSIGAGNSSTYLSMERNEPTNISSIVVRNNTTHSMKLRRHCMNKSSNTISIDTSATDLFYDSDPGHVKARVSRKGSRRALIETLDLMDEKRVWRIINHKREVQITDDELLSDFIKKTIYETLHLVWHPSQDEQNTNKSPICVQGWIELGSQLKNTFVQPKFMWRASYEPRKRNLHLLRPPKSIDLLDICRILEASKINRSKHPFAKTGCSLTIETNLEIFLFEAFSNQERDRIVYGMKLVVARLASQLIAGDIGVYEEFFSPFGEVPGGHPTWAETNESTSHR